MPKLFTIYIFLSSIKFVTLAHFHSTHSFSSGFSIIRILQEDVFKDKYDWLKELCDNIEKITNENRVQNIYMCKNNEYKDFDIN